MRNLLTCVSAFALTISANAEMVIVDHGTGPPPGCVGPWPITALPFDSRPEYSDVTGAPGYPVMSGDLTWGIPMTLLHVGSGWATWSHGYEGVVYYSNGAHSATMTLPDPTMTFLMYVQPLSSTWGTFTLTLDDGTSVTRSIHGSGGAAGFGFYGVDGPLSPIVVSGTSDFAWGEFFCGDVPEPAASWLLLVGAAVAARRRV